jgi:hypothetical protein
VRSTRDLFNILDMVAKTGAPIVGAISLPVPRSAEWHWIKVKNPDAPAATRVIEG